MTCGGISPHMSLQEEEIISMDESQKPQYSCPACGAKLEYAPGVQALQCPYCGTKVDIATGEKLPHSNDSRYIVPMTIDRQKLQNVAYKYMFSQEDAPDDILDYATFTKTQLRYVPCYVFNGHYEAVWTASFGYDRTECYMVNGKIQSRIITDWRPANGQDFGDFTVMSYAGEPLPRQVISMVESFSSLENMKNYDPAYLINSEVSEFATTAEEVYQQDAENKVNMLIRKNIYKHAQGDRQRDWHWKSEVRKEAVPVLVPIGQMTFEYKGGEYTIWCDGTDDGVFTGDALPVDMERRKKIRKGHIPWIGTIIGAIVGYMIFKETYTWWAFVIPVVVMFLFWSLRRASIKNYSRKLKQSSLTNYQISNNISNEDAESISRNLKVPDKPFLLSLTAYDLIILPLLPLICFGISCGLQNAFPSKPVPVLASSGSTKVKSSSNSNKVKVKSLASSQQGKTAQQSDLEEAIRFNRKANEKFTNTWSQVPPKKKTALISKVRNTGKQIDAFCKKTAVKAPDEMTQKTIYLNCTAQRLEKLTATVQKSVP